MAKKSKVKEGLYLLFVIFFVGNIIFPFLWQLINSFKTQVDLFSIPPVFWPSEWTLDNYREVFTMQPFLLYLKNSFVISTMVTIICILIGSMASYSISRTNIKGKKLFMVGLLTITLLPPITIINPIYRLLKTMGLLNTYLGLTLANTTLQLPMTVWFLQGFFQKIPKSIEESAELDGASVIQVFFRIILPLVLPGVFTVGILTFIGAWNQYLFAQVLNPLKIRRTVTVGLTLYQTDYTVPWGTMTAASVIITFPLIIMVLIMQRRIISGMLDGGIKE
ncbi:MAG: carbohydrate ABC transporter permease [Firmicutes bacterium]|nr:carbohydrate ABC transporter permease [Bacillota bacterium]